MRERDRAEELRHIVAELDSSQVVKPKMKIWRPHESHARWLLRLPAERLFPMSKTSMENSPWLDTKGPFDTTIDVRNDPADSFYIAELREWARNLSHAEVAVLKWWTYRRRQIRAARCPRKRSKGQ